MQRVDVFISSTVIDLVEYRHAVTEAILNLGLYPSALETWPVEDQSSVDICRQKIADAEIYLGIYAHRYGWRPKGYDGKNITELEYDWAGEKGIPRFCFIMDNRHPFPQSQMELDALDSLNAFKARVKERFIGFFTTPDDLKARVVAALAPYAQRINETLALPYIRALHQESRKSGLLRVLDPRTNDPTHSGRNITIDQVYVPLNTTRAIHVDENGNILPNLELTDAPRSVELGVRTPLTAMEAADRARKLVLLGNPGSGKSTFVNFLTLCLTGHRLDAEGGWSERMQAQKWTHGAPLPVLVILRDFAQSIDPDAPPSAHVVWDYVVRQLERHNCADAGQALKVLLERGRLLILFDGLDEVPQERRDFVRDAIDLFVQAAHPENRFIVTCRVLSYTVERYRIPDFEIETIAPLDEAQIDEFITTWYAALQALNSIDTPEAEKRVHELQQAIRENHLEPIAENPMLLTVMALVHNHTGTLPRERARLYEECVELLLLRWRPNDARALIEILGIREDDLRRLVWEIAYDAHDKQADREGAADIPEAAVLGIARRRLNDDMTKAAEFTQYVERRAGLLIGRGYDEYGLRVFTFPHRTFQEYLAGCYVASDRFNRKAAQLAKRGVNWREALLLATGHLVFNKTDIATPLDAISLICPERMALNDDAEWRQVWLAAEMLQLVGVENAERDEEVGQEVLPRVRERLALLVGGGHLPPVERAEAGRLLAKLGDPRPGVSVRTDGLPDIAWSDPIPADTNGQTFTFGGGKDEQQIAIPYSYRIAKYPVTYAQYAAFVSSDGYTNKEYWTDAGWAWREKEKALHPTALWNDPQWHIANHPVVGVTWYESYAFCRWLSAKTGQDIRLPTEAEWEKAARGKDGLIYPYGNTFDPSKGNTSESGIGRTSAVGMFPGGASPYGAHDLSGNVWEWCQSKYAGQYHFPEDNDNNGTDVRVLRGGSWDYSQDFARAAYRLNGYPNLWFNYFGFCVVVGSVPI